MKRKLSCLILILSICVFTSSLYAASYSPESYKPTVNNYIDEIQQIRAQLLTLSQNISFSLPESMDSINTGIDLINRDLNNIMDSMESYYNTLPNQSTERRTLLLLFNALNLMRSSLFELNQLTTATTPVEKILLLENYFRFRVEATDTIELVKSLLSQM